MPDDDLLTTAEAARMAGVGASSVKRWADLNRIRSVRTLGGHRRFKREDVEEFVRELHGGPSGNAQDWADLLLSADSYEVQGEILRARGRLGAWYRVAEELATGIAELGSRWARGEIKVIEEHVASEKLARALQRTTEALPSSEGNPRAVLATASDDDHTLGLSLVELTLRECGWNVVWSGRGTPLADLIELVSSGTVALVGVSASEISTDAASLAGQAQELGAACREAGVELMLGGKGSWPETPEYGTRVHDLKTLYELALDWRTRATRR